VARYGVTERRRAGVYSRTSGIGCTSRTGPSSTASRRRSAAANAGRGASGTFGSRSVSNGSVVMGFTSRVSDSERVAGAYEQRFGRVHGSIEVMRDLGYRQAVDVAQGQRAAMMRAQRFEHVVRTGALEPFVEVVVGFALVGEELQVAFFARDAAPMV